MHVFLSLCLDLPQINVFLTNRMRSFHDTAITQTGTSDHHKLITSFFILYFEQIPPKKVEHFFERSGP